MMKWFWLALLGFAPFLHAELNPLAVPGGVALIDLGPAQEQQTPPQIWLDQQPVAVIARQGHWQALVGIPLDTPSGALELRQGATPDTGKSLSLQVQPKSYPAQYLSLKNKGQVNLSPADEARALKEIEEIKALKRTWRPTPYVDTAFIQPAKGRLSSRFGLQRFFNGEARAPHSGLDVAAAKGATVFSAGAGKVLAVGDYFFNGKSVFVDHGQGLISLYCHLDTLTVHEGQWLEKGQTLGTVGSTGRATGPHLHWTVVLNGTNVDPALFIQP